MIRPPSNQKAYDTFWSGDSALIQPPDDATQEQRDEHARQVRIARETGNWSALTIEGQEPTKFTLRPVPGEVWRILKDLVNAGTVGNERAAHLLLRCALVGTTFDAAQVRLEIPNEPALAALGRIATVDVPDRLDAANPGIVTELAGGVLARMRGLPLG